MERISQFALLALALVITACSPACTPPEPNAPGSTKVSGAEETVAQGRVAEAAVPVASDEMIMEAQGVDLRKLAESQRATFFQIINTEPSACDKPHSLAKSIRDDATCRDSLIAAQFVADTLASGSSPSEVKEKLEFVVQSLHPRAIDIAGSPIYGSESAPVTIVEFADFQCPHCKMEAPALRQAIDQFRGRAKLVFKHFPLGSHPLAKEAAIATVAAQAQGKFWEMHDLVFANQNTLSEADLVKYAGQIGLDVDRFQTDRRSARAAQQVADDRKLGESLKIEGTPAVFVNGRYFHPMLFGGSVVGWIDDALKR